MALIDFTLSNARQFYSGNPLGWKGLSIFPVVVTIGSEIPEKPLSWCSKHSLLIPIHGYKCCSLKPLMIIIRQQARVFNNYCNFWRCVAIVNQRSRLCQTMCDEILHCCFANLSPVPHPTIYFKVTYLLCFQTGVRSHQFNTKLVQLL